VGVGAARDVIRERSSSSTPTDIRRIVAGMSRLLFDRERCRVRSQRSFGSDIPTSSCRGRTPRMRRRRRAISRNVCPLRSIGTAASPSRPPTRAGPRHRIPGVTCLLRRDAPCRPSGSAHGVASRRPRFLIAAMNWPCSRCRGYHSGWSSLTCCSDRSVGPMDGFGQHDDGLL